MLGAVFGICGSPALSPQDFAAHDPGASMGVLARVSLPTGAYDSDRVVNLGSNRVWGQLGLPMGNALGASCFDPALMTFEFIPPVIFRGDNSDPFGPASSTGQDPLGIIEAHFTRNFSRAFRSSLVRAIWPTSI